jgi:hypothetical protein
VLKEAYVDHKNRNGSAKNEIKINISQNILHEQSLLEEK